MPRPPTGTRPRPLQRWWVAVLVYVAAGLVWVIVGDALLFTTQAEPRWFSLAKGVFYVLITGAVAAGVLARSQRRLDRTLGELSAREGELALLGAHAQDLLYRIELVPVLRVAFVSDSAERIVGYTPQEHYEDPDLARRLIHPEDRHLLRDLAVMDGTVRLRWVHRDGRVVWCEQQNRVQIEEGRAVSIVGVGRDVTADVLRNGVARATAQLSGEVLEGEAAFEDALDRALRTLLQLFEAASVRVEIAAGGRGCRGHRLEVGDPGAAVAPGRSLAAAQDATRVRVVTTVASSEPCMLEELLGVVAERIDTVHAAAGRDWELRQLEQALDSSASGVMLTDRAGRVEWVNRAFTTITGYDASEVIGRFAGLVFDGVENGFAAEQAAAIASGRSFAGGVVHRRRDGTRYTAAVALDPVPGREGEPAGFVTILRDVTADEEERERVRQRELEALARWQEIERDRSLLVQTISHELRTPLTVVLGTAETLSAREVERAHREQLLTALARAKREVLGRLDVLLAATDGIDGPAEPVRARALVEAALLTLWREHDVTRVAIEGDATWTGQHLLAKALLAPLLDNALAHAPEGTRVLVELGSDDTGLAVVITDQGPGIPDEVLVRLDQPFHQADQGMTRRHGGLGLGLYAARRVADRLGGRLEVGRRECGGTEARVWLPDTEVVRR